MTQTGIAKRSDLRGTQERSTVDTSVQDASSFIPHPSSLHILFITGEYPPMQGGVGAYTAELAAALVELGAQVSVLTSTRAGQARPATRMDRASSSEIAVHGDVARWGPALWQRAPAYARRLGVNWLHVQYQTAAFGMNPSINLAPWWWRRAGLRVAWTYHDLLVPYLFPKAGARLRRWVTRLPARLCDLTIVTNESDRLELAQAGLAAQTSPIGSNIRAREFSAAARQALRREYGYASDNDAERDIVVGYFGFLNRSKGGLTLVRTLDALIQAGLPAHLLMIGERVGASDPTNYAYLQEVEALIDRLQLQARVRWTGRLDDADVSAALAVCDVLLMPYADGASLRRGTLMAGLAHGCAIVTTHPPGAPWAPLPELEDGVHVRYVPPDNPQAAAHTIQEIVTDPELAQRLRDGAHQASRLFTWEAIAAQHVEMYDKDEG